MVVEANPIARTAIARLLDQNGCAVLSAASVNQWNQLSVPLTLGVHNVEWRYQKDSYGTQGADAAWIDNVAFVGQ